MQAQSWTPKLTAEQLYPTSDTKKGQFDFEKSIFFFQLYSQKHIHSFVYLDTKSKNKPINHSLGASVSHSFYNLLCWSSSSTAGFLNVPTVGSDMAWIILFVLLLLRLPRYKTWEIQRLRMAKSSCLIVVSNSATRKTRCARSYCGWIIF